MKKENPKPDDPARSKRFKEVAGKLGIDLNEDLDEAKLAAKLTEVLRRVSGQEPKKKKKPADEYHR